MIQRHVHTCIRSTDQFKQAGLREQKWQKWDQKLWMAKGTQTLKYPLGEKEHMVALKFPLLLNKVLSDNMNSYI